MKTVLLTGAGGAPSPGLIRHLKQSGFRVLAADMDKFAPGLFIADKGFIIPAGKSPDFLNAMRNICNNESVDVIIPGVDEELIPVLELENEGISILLPQLDFVKLCLDKYLLMQCMKSKDISVPETRLATQGAGDLQFPVIVKPRIGRGSRHIKIVSSENDLKDCINSLPYSPEQILLQEYIDGQEFTVSVIVWRDGLVQAVVPKEIILKKGITYLAVTRYNQFIENMAKEIQEKMKANGPFNLQLKIDKNSQQPVPFEINPRFSTTISLTIASGIDELTGLINQAIGDTKNHFFGEWQEGTVLLRQTYDQFITEEDYLKSQILNEC